MTTFTETGESPARVVTQHGNDGPEVMLTEIAPHLFVGWDICSTCRRHVRSCECRGGPTEPPYIARWREERSVSTPVRTEPEPEPTPVEKALDAATEAVQSHRRIEDIEVGF